MMNKINFLKKIHFYIKKPPVIIVAGEGKVLTIEAIGKVLEKYKKKVLIFNMESESKLGNLEFFIKNSSLPILIVGYIGDIPLDKIRDFAKRLPARGYLVLNSDDETIREIKKESSARLLSFGLQLGSDFQITDIKLNAGTNFKINHEGDIVPVWLEKLLDKEQIYSVLAAAAVGVIFDFNLIEISQALST